MEDRKKLKTREALLIIYYLMAVDGEICQAEEDKFITICEALDPDFNEEAKEMISKRCQKQLDKVIDEDEYYDVIKEGVEACLQEEYIEHAQIKFLGRPPFIDGRLLVWDLLTIAFSDGKYTEEERKLIKLVTRKLDIDKSLLLEMENSIKTILALDREEAWLRKTNRSYTSIESLINEISNRRNIIKRSVDQLIVG